MAIHNITQAELKSILHYDPDTGIFTWLIKPNGRVCKGAKAGSVSCSGYEQISYKKKNYLSHRLAWLYMYGSFPELSIDHINRIKTDNKASNLREIAFADNLQNVGVRKHNTSGIVGVSWHKSCQKWQAELVVAKKRFYLGLFDSLESAAYARSKAEKQYHPFRPIT